MAARPVDVLLFVEHVARELDIACALKYLAAERHQLTVEIASMNRDLGATLRAVQPSVVAVPYCYSALPEDPGQHQMLAAWPEAVYLNLAYEQVFQRINQDFKVPRDVFAREHVLHHAWGDFGAEALRARGVPEAHIIVNGNPSYALYRPPYQAYFETSRTDLARRYGLDAEKRWVFVPENYGAAFLDDRSLRDHIRRGYDPREAHEYRAFARDSLRTAVGWWQHAADSGALEVIVRPRPYTPLGAFQRVCRRALGRRRPAFKIIKEGTVREWVLVSDVVASSYSTTLIEAAVACKPIVMAVPLPFPAFVQADWYQHVPQATSAAAFLQLIGTTAPAVSWEPLKGWAESRMLSRGDPLINLADLLAALVRRERRIPEPFRVAAAPAAGRIGWWSRLLCRARLERRRIGQLRRHEQDRLTDAEVGLRVAKWAEVLGEDTAAERVAYV